MSGQTQNTPQGHPNMQAPTPYLMGANMHSGSSESNQTPEYLRNPQQNYQGGQYYGQQTTGASSGMHGGSSSATPQPQPSQTYYNTNYSNGYTYPQTHGGSSQPQGFSGPYIQPGSSQPQQGGYGSSTNQNQGYTQGIPMQNLPPQTYQPPTNANPANAPPTAANGSLPQSGGSHVKQWQPSKKPGGYWYNLGKSYYKLKFPKMYQDRGINPGDQEGQHFDILGRPYKGKLDDRYLSPWDGHVAKLVVQCTQDIYDESYKRGPAAAVTWRRTFIRHSSPWLLRLTNWTFDELEQTELSGTGKVKLFFKWIITMAGLFFVILIPVDAGGQIRNGGKYDNVPYRYWGYARQPRNAIEDKDRFTDEPDGTNAGRTRAAHRTFVRGMLGNLTRKNKPDFLCFSGSENVDKVESVATWEQHNQRDASYVFVSWTSKHFNPVDNPEDREFLHALGTSVAAQEGTDGYWVSFCCLAGPNTTREELEENVWQICDIVRGSRKMIVAISQSTQEAKQQWSGRVWTLPELVLSPRIADIPIYTPGNELTAHEIIPRRNFPLKIIANDETAAKALVDHFEGNAQLNSLELTTVALQCLHERGHPEYLRGDISYALMGLLRQRPPVNRWDNSFQAFARLSLANDSDQLLERLICILPRDLNQPWHDMGDQWGAVLWDIYPSTQVCGIGEKSTVIVDGARAAAVRWKSFAAVAQLKREAWGRFFVRLAIRSSGYAFWIGVAFVSVPQLALRVVGAFALLYALFWLLPAPYVLRKLYGGKVWGAQPWFFAFEGYLDIETIERMIFGLQLGALSWSAAGSPLSLHKPDEFGRCIGRDPIEDPQIRARIRKAVTSQMGEEKIFTLVDTGTLTVTLFSAVRPPVAVIACGEEGGMMRALMCSYDWQSQTFYRETVLRMESPVYENMSPIGRIRLGMNAGFTRDD